MAKLAIKGHPTRGKEVIEILEMFGGYNTSNWSGDDVNAMYFTNTCYHIDKSTIEHSYARVLSLEEFLKKFPYKVGDKVRTVYGKIGIISKLIWSNRDDCIRYELEADTDRFYFVNELQPYKEETLGECIEKTIQECLFGKKETMEEINIDRIGFNGDKAKLILPLGYEFKTEGKEVYVVKKQPYKEETKPEDMGEVSDGYHTFNELYEYRMLYNAALFNEFAKQGLYDVHKSKRHSDGTIPFGDGNWFIVQAELPTGQISNHYEMKDWELFDVPEKEKANHYDGHTPQDVAKRLRNFLTPKPKYPKTYEECCEVLGKTKAYQSVSGYKTELLEDFQKLLICRDAYWKIAGEQMELGKPWKPEYIEGVVNTYYTIHIFNNKLFCAGTSHRNSVLSFSTEEMRDAFYENFKELIEQCKELL